jgi:F-type H+-transporting ATPase subunit gamma
MAGGTERILRRRIKSVNQTKKITRAMELIAASRIVRAQQRVAAAVPYSEQITSVVKDLAGSGAGGSVLLVGRGEVKNTAFIAITADRGLCGGYNTGVLRATEGEIKERVQRGQGYKIVAVGRKAEGYLRFRGYDLGAVFTGFSDNPSYENARAIAGAATEMFEQGTVDEIRIVYTRFASAGVQEVVERPLVPLGDEIAAGDGDAALKADYEIEPDSTTVLNAILPRYVEARVYAALLNAAASEHAFRQRAMKSATDNAEELIRNLTRVMNRARQEAITTEIMEIVGGAEALSQGGDDDGRFVDILDPMDVAEMHAFRIDQHGGDDAPRINQSEADAIERDIDGIGPKIDEALQAMGITTFKQIAQWSDADVQRITEELKFFPGRIEREDWIGQAKRFHFEKYGEQL